MKLRAHIVQGVFLSPVAYAVLGLKGMLLFVCSFILIDADHYMQYIYRCRRLGVRGMFAFYDELWEKRGSVYGLSLFHTVEALIALWCLGYWHEEFRIIGAGFLTHLLADIVHLHRHGVLRARAFSLLEYIVRSRALRIERPDVTIL